MADDFLGRLCKSPAKGLIAQDAAKEEYVAFTCATGRQLRLHVRPDLRAWERLPYFALHRIMEDGPLGTEIVLIYSFGVVVIKGRNLFEVAEAIGNENCESVQAFAASRFTEPSDKTVPFIDTIDFHMETRDGMVRATDDALADIAKVQRVTN